MEPYQRIHDLRKRGQIQEAYNQAKELLNQQPRDLKLRSSFGWVLYEQAKILYDQVKTKQKEDCKGEIERILQEFKELNLPRPSMLFSRFLFYIIRLPGAETTLPGFMAWAGLNCFEPGDFKAQKGEHYTYDSLVEKAARETAKASRGLDPQQQRYAISLLDKAMNHAEVQKMVWLQYHKGSLLVELGLLEEARSLLVPVVQTKRTEFWAWQTLGQIEEGVNPEMALSLYAKGILVCKDPKFGWRLYEDLCRMALKHNQEALAKWAASQAVSIHQDNGWRLRQSLLDLVDSNWYSKAEEETDPETLLKSLAARADAYLYADSPRYPGSYMGTFKSKKDKLMFKLVCRIDKQIREVVSPVHGLPVDQLSPGDPVTVGLLTDQDRPVITAVESREGGSPFDCLPQYYGVIDYHHPSGRVSVYITQSLFCSLPYKDFPQAEAWQPGTPVSLRCLEYKGRLQPYEAKETGFKETGDIRLVQGIISVKPQGFAFVEKTFVPPYLACKYTDNERVALVAAKKPDKRKNVMGWCAIGPWVK